MPNSESEKYPQRRVFVRRRTRTTVAQSRGLSQAGDFQLDPSELDRSANTGTKIFLEIGFGNGEATAAFAKAHPKWLCVGVEVFEPGVGALVNQCLKENLQNVRIVSQEGHTFLESLRDEILDEVWILFPDPWPKKRHHKRRILTAEFVECLSQKTANNGRVRIATDWIDYAEAISDLFKGSSSFRGGLIGERDDRVTTKYERRGLKLGHVISEFAYTKTEGPR